MELSTLGLITTIIYLIGIFGFHWVTDWYFNVTKSVTLDYLYATWMWVTKK
jgi:hypothetical protein